MVDPINDDVSGAINHFFFLKLSNIWTSKSWAVKKAIPDPIAILIDIRSPKLVEKLRSALADMNNPLLKLNKNKEEKKGGK